MRLSVDPEDSGHMAAGISAQVFLNGLPLALCITADEELGAVECYKADADGHLALSESGEPEFQTLRGKVRIDLSDCTWPAELVGFDIWMRARTDRAHAEYMAGHAAGGISY